MTRPDLFLLCLRLGLTRIPLGPRSKKPLVKWGNGWDPTQAELEVLASANKTSVVQWHPSFNTTRNTESLLAKSIAGGTTDYGNKRLC